MIQVGVLSPMQAGRQMTPCFFPLGPGRIEEVIAEPVKARVKNTHLLGAVGKPVNIVAVSKHQIESDV